MMELVWANTGDIFARGKVVKKTMYIYIVNLHCCTIYGVKSTLKIRQVFIVHADADEAGSLQGL